MTCNRLNFGVGFGILTVVLLISSLAVPWFFTRTSTDSSTVIFLTGWFKEYCYASGGTAQCLQSETYWRSAEKTATETVYNVSFALCLISLFCAFFLTSLAVFYRFHSSGPKTQNTTTSKAVFIVVSIVGLFLLVTSIGYFALFLPSAMRSDLPKGVLCTDGPCLKFVGSADVPGVTISWGPVGWIPAVVAVPFFLAMAGCSLPLQKLSYEMVE
eukprot:TRINITY_DN8442_c0_g1_i1.p1 TRINITY_DN8442_c0_g1~~TRINITY_DN8442_c0_g1_i1.p1  ORF type:complete len:240 (-),score=32.29 TRINITY_DN8442_c0_g1_i1:95-736(-)